MENNKANIWWNSLQPHQQVSFMAEYFGDECQEVSPTQIEIVYSHTRYLVEKEEGKVKQHIEINNETYLHRNYVEESFAPRLLKVMLEKGRIKIVPGQEEYFSTIKGVPTDLFKEYFPLPNEEDKLKEVKSVEEIAEEYVKQSPALTGIFRQVAIKDFIAGYNTAYHAQFTQVKGREVEFAEWIIDNRYNYDFREFTKEEIHEQFINTLKK